MVCLLGYMQNLPNSHSFLNMLDTKHTRALGKKISLLTKICTNKKTKAIHHAINTSNFVKTIQLKSRKCRNNRVALSQHCEGPKPSN